MATKTDDEHQLDVIDRAVARERERRRKSSLVYLLLLLIPTGLASLALILNPSMVDQVFSKAADDPDFQKKLIDKASDNDALLKSLAKQIIDLDKEKNNAFSQSVARVQVEQDFTESVLKEAIDRLGGIDSLKQEIAKSAVDRVFAQPNEIESFRDSVTSLSVQDVLAGPDGIDALRKSVINGAVVELRTDSEFKVAISQLLAEQIPDDEFIRALNQNEDFIAGVSARLRADRVFLAEVSNQLASDENLTTRLLGKIEAAFHCKFYVYVKENRSELLPGAGLTVGVKDVQHNSVSPVTISTKNENGEFEQLISFPEIKIDTPRTFTVNGKLHEIELEFVVARALHRNIAGFKLTRCDIVAEVPQ